MRVLGGAIHLAGRRRQERFRQLEWGQRQFVRSGVTGKRVEFLIDDAVKDLARNDDHLLSDQRKRENRE